MKTEKEHFKGKVGEWCYHDFELCIIKKALDDGSVISEVSDGICNYSSSYLNNTCYPLTIEIKRISDSVKHWHDKLHQIKKVKLNYARIQDKLVEIWVEMCDNKDNTKELEKLYEKLNNFGLEIIKKVDYASCTEVDGVNIFL